MREFTSFSLSLILLGYYKSLISVERHQLETQLWVLMYLKCSNMIKNEIILEGISLTGSEASSYFNTVVQCFRLTL